MMFNKPHFRNKKFNILLFIAGLTLGAILGFILIQNNNPQPEPQKTEDTTTKIAPADESQTSDKSQTVDESLNPNETPTPDSNLPDSDATNPTPRKSDLPTAIGNQQAKVVMYEFSDFQCPYCHDYAENTFPLIKKNYIDTGKILYIFKNLPLSQHRQAQLAAKTANCAAQQNMFWEMHDTLFKKQSEWSSSPEPDQIFAVYAKEMGLSEPDYETCVPSEETENNIQSDIDFATKKDVSLTPTFYINDTKLTGAHEYKVFEKTLNEELSKNPT